MASSLVPPDVDPCEIPAAVPPDGQLPNLVNPTSLATATIVTSVLLTVWALVFVAARVMVNRRKLSWSDYFMVIGMIFDTAFTVVAVAKAKYYRHLWDVPACWILDTTFIKLDFVYNIFMGPAVYFSKSSIFLLYQQFFSVKKSMEIAIYIGLAATFLAYFPYIPLVIRYLSPLGRESWEDLIMADDRAKMIYWGIVSGSLAVVLDIYIFVLPLPTLATLHMSLKTRVQLIAVFATALMGVVASVVALVYRVEILYRTDPTWRQGASGMAILVENNVAIIVGSMPAVATFVRVYVSESTIIKTLRSKIRRTHDSELSKDPRSSFRKPNLATFGSPNVQRPGNYELTDPTVTAAQVIPDLFDIYAEF
ncbi:hypothetical protein LA080_006745 [Diaporthe eres]|nr:hypothetical protein LA080_006745 [Diaporthe eres]